MNKTNFIIHDCDSTIENAITLVTAIRYTMIISDETDTSVSHSGSARPNPPLEISSFDELTLDILTPIIKESIPQDIDDFLIAELEKKKKTITKALDIRSAGAPPPPPNNVQPVPPTQEEMERIFKDQVVAAIQQRLDIFAKTRNYDNILSACTYVNSKNEKFAAEGKYATEIRDLTWEAAYKLLDDVTSGKIPAPTSFAEIELILPELSWPT